MFNSLRAAYEPALDVLAPLLAGEVGQVDAYRVLTAALGEGDPDTARAAADRVLRPSTDAPADRAGDSPCPACRGGPMTDESPRSRPRPPERLAADEARHHGLSADAP